MIKSVYLFKTDGTPFHFKMKDVQQNKIYLVYGINPDLPDYKGQFEMHGQRIHELFIDKSFETASWMWDYYMPALHATGAILFNILRDGN